VFDFLKKYSNIDKMFTTKEISKKIKINRISVTRVCRKLRQNNDIRFIIEKDNRGRIDCYKYYCE